MPPDENRPLLVLGAPNVSTRSGLPQDMRVTHLPQPNRQKQRLGNKFRDLRIAFTNQNVRLVREATGVEPEKVIVFEIISSSKVDEFYKALRNVDGLQWLSEFDGEEFEGDDDFYVTSFDDDERLGKLRRRLYLIVANQRGIRTILSFWRQYLRGGQGIFPRGQTKWKHLFSLLHDIRVWDAGDRVLATGLEEDWNARVREGRERVRVEIEMWFRADPVKRADASEQVRSLLQAANGTLITESVIESIRYHAILVELPIATVQGIVARSENIQLVKSDPVMFFRPGGQVLIRTPIGTDHLDAPTIPPATMLDDRIHIALLDGLPVENHETLQGRIEVDDVEGWAATTPLEHRRHGTAMASLIAHNDLSNHQGSLRTRIYIRPILKPIDPDTEVVPEDKLVVDLVHLSLKRIFEGTEGSPAVHPSVKVINFSVGERYRPFVKELSPLARLLDWYAFQYSVLFIVSAGNHYADVKFNSSSGAIETMAEEVREREAIANWTKEATMNRILSPSESLNSLCVGSSNSDESTIQPAVGRISLLKSPHVPCLYNPVGMGFRNAIKPDLFAPGGRVLYRSNVSGPAGSVFSLVDSPTRPPGQKAAFPSTVAGQTNRTAFTVGTSNSAALSTHLSGKIIEQFLEGRLVPNPPEEYWSVLVKALLVHCCDWGEAKAILTEVAPAEIRTNAYRLKSWITRFLGHGAMNLDRALSGDIYRATALGFGAIGADKAHEFTFPLPQGLSNTQVLRRLTVSLAWFSPIETNNKKYRCAQLWFEQSGSSVADPLQISRARYDRHAVRRGTVQHEIFEGSQLAPYANTESVKIKINCRHETGSGRLPDIRYALAVSLEDADRSIQTIYDEIRARIVVPPTRVRV